MSGDDRHGKKKKIAIISVSALILVAMVVAVAVGVTSSHKGGEDEKKPATTSKAIETVCQPTDYKETCQNTLSEKAGNVSDPKELVKIGFQAAMDKLQEVINNSDTLKELAKDDMANQALQNCKELIEYSIDDLKRSFEKIGPFEVTKLKEYVEDLKIWLSASINYEQTCLDGFNNTAGDAGAKMKEFLKASQELTKNGLAMASELSNVFGNSNLKNQRRLLADTPMDSNNKVPKIIPAWIEARKLDLATATPLSLRPDVVVAKDGSGKYETVNEALKDIPKNNAQKTFVIHIKAGEYNEQVILDKHMTNVMFIGDGPTETKITGDKNYADGVQTFKTATVAVIGDYFIAKDIGFENTAGARGHQAVALRVQSDLSIFYNCQIDGYQDTLYTQTHRQFYRDCTISGTIDFIFGDGAVVFQNCKMIIRKPDPDQNCMVTAQGRTDKREPTGIVIQNCTITAEKDYVEPKMNYLGRPWKPFARTIVMQSQIDDVINPIGWMEWTGTNNHETSWFGEYSNRGLGAATNQRAKWYKLATPEEADAFTAGNMLSGDRWIGSTGVPYVAGMMRVSGNQTIHRF